MITELFRFSDDELILKMRYSDLLNLGNEIFDLLYKKVPNEEYTYCKQLLEVIKGNDETQKKKSICKE